MRAAIAMVALLACSSPAPAPQQPQHHAPAASIDLARAYELGHGVPRDYRAAAKLYGERCRDGCGDLPSCRSYFQLASRNRGIVMAGDVYARLAGTLCDRGVKLACFDAAYMGMRDPSKLAGDDEQLAKQCDGGDADACELVGGLGFNQSGAAEARERAALEKGCELGRIELCSKMFVVACDRANSAASCVEGAQAEASRESNPELRRYLVHKAALLRDTLRRLDAACTDGDVDACEGISGREVAHMARCEAGDFDVCRRMGKDGDARAAELACRAGLGGNCGVEEVPPAAAVQGYLRVLGDDCKKGDAAACERRREFTAPTTCPP